jgi:hypothetical protein
LDLIVNLTVARIAATLAPEDGEIAFNLAAVLEACKIRLTAAPGGLWLIHLLRSPGGQLEAALAQYKRSLEYNINRAEQNIRNVCATLWIPLCAKNANTEPPCKQVSAKIFGQRLKEATAGQEVTRDKKS